jgi:mannose-1-phosphate guanylyltransferase
MNKDHYALIMAGGIGSRFWPESTPEYPKQFLDLTGTGQSLLQQTFKRIAAFIPESNIYFLTTEQYRSIVLEQLPTLMEGQLLCEPVQRNTAPCVLMGVKKIHSQNPSAKILVAPSDHLIRDEQAFQKDMMDAFEHSNADNLITFGIRPSHPATGYGYIKSENSASLAAVEEFTEKPDLKTAERYVTDGAYFWNAGIFVWSADAILKAFEAYEPEMCQLFSDASIWNTNKEVSYIQSQFPLAKEISIDYAILERSPWVKVIPARFDWNDLGSWSALHSETDQDDQGNAVINAQLFAEDASGNLIKTSAGKKVLLVGLKDYIVVENNSVLMILPKSSDQGIKKLGSAARAEWKKP